ncbi:MAG: hypothetical protein JF565_04745, partial [Propionibacteriales bacterium]|nr:hypothetical protein [Propionibacteriales bacterium]
TVFGLVRHDASSWPLLIVFALLLVRAIVVPPYRPTPRQAGIGEVVATVAVATTSLLV